MTEFTQKHHVLGAGSIGYLVTCLLKLGGIDSVLIKHHANTNESVENVIYDHLNDSQSLTTQTITIERATKLDIVWVAVKSYQLPSALASIKSYCNKNTWIILLQNGMGNLEVAHQILHSVVPPNQLIAVANTHGAVKQQHPDYVLLQHSGVGQLMMGYNYFAEQAASPPEFLAQLPKTMNIEWTEDIETKLWLKLGINAVINPLTALYQCKNGDLLTTDNYQQHVDRLIRELVELYERINYPTLAKQFPDQCYDVINTTASNQSSMMLDVKRGQQTEIEAITGYLLNHANRVRLSMNEHQKLYHQLLNC